MKTDTLLGEGRAEAMLLRAKQTFDQIQATLNDGVAKLQDSTDPEVRAYSTTLQLYWKSLQAVQERESELDKLRRERAGIADGYALDLVAARGEVGRRLA